MLAQSVLANPVIAGMADIRAGRYDQRLGGEIDQLLVSAGSYTQGTDFGGCNERCARMRPRVPRTL